MCPQGRVLCSPLLALLELLLPNLLLLLLQPGVARRIAFSPVFSYASGLRLACVCVCVGSRSLVVSTCRGGSTPPAKKKQKAFFPAKVKTPLVEKKNEKKKKSTGTNPAFPAFSLLSEIFFFFTCLFLTATQRTEHSSDLAPSSRYITYRALSLSEPDTPVTPVAILSFVAGLIDTPASPR